MTVPWMLLLVALQRLAELVLAARNSRRLRARGAVEFGARHYPLFVLLHGGWLAAMAVGIPWDRSAEPIPLLAYFGLQPLRLWVIRSLGAFWTTRVLVVPGTRPVRRGPYRWLRHPNYAIVALEVPLLPLAYGAVRLALWFGLANLVLLGWRMRVENRAWAEIPATAEEEPSGSSSAAFRTRKISFRP